MSQAKLSVIIASCVGAPFISRCLQSLEGECVAAGVECLVIDRAGADVADAIERDFPWVTVIRRPAGESVPDLRRYGISVAKSEYVAIIEEHCVARGDWIATILRS